MAGNRRGKLKEEFEGVHRNFDWVRKHLIQSLALIQEHNPKLSGAVKALAEGVDTLDDITQGIYSKI